MNHSAALSIRSKGILIPTRHLLASTLCILLNYIMISKHSYGFLWHSYRNVVNSFCIVQTRVTTWCTTGAPLLFSEKYRLWSLQTLHTKSYFITPAYLISREHFVLRSLKFLSSAAHAPPAWSHMSHTALISYENHKYMCVQVEE